MIEVRIRTSDETGPVHLCMWDADDVDGLIPILKGWGVHDNRTCNEWSGDDAEISGRMVIDHGCSYFEVVLHEDSADDS